MLVVLLITAVESGFTCAREGPAESSSASTRKASRNGGWRGVDMSSRAGEYRPGVAYAPFHGPGERRDRASGAVSASTGWTKREVEPEARRCGETTTWTPFRSIGSGGPGGRSRRSWAR